MRTAWVMVCFDGLAGMDILAAARIPPILPRPAGRRLIELMAAARDLDPAVASGDLAAMARQHRVGFQMLEVLLDHAGIRRLAPPDPELERLLPAVRFVEANLGKSISTAELARLAGLSPSRFYSVFKRVMGVTPMGYVQNIRLRLAQHLLLTSPVPVGDVAAQTGFASPYYFCRAFRRHWNTTPTAFRRDFSRFQRGSEGGR